MNISHAFFCGPDGCKHIVEPKKKITRTIEEYNRYVRSLNIDGLKGTARIKAMKQAEAARKLFK